MKALIVLTFDLTRPDDLISALDAINPISLPHFAGEARIVAEPHASELTTWLDGDDDEEEQT